MSGSSGTLPRTGRGAGCSAGGASAGGGAAESVGAGSAGGAAGSAAVPGTPAPRQDRQVPAACGAPQQHALQRDGAHEAALDVGKDDRHRRGAEELRDGGEAAPDGAMFEGLGEVAAVFDEDGKDGEQGRDTLGHGLPGSILWGIG